jgi:hypothetical protein
MIKEHEIRFGGRDDFKECSLRVFTDHFIKVPLPFVFYMFKSWYVAVCLQPKEAFTLGENKIATATP